MTKHSDMRTALPAGTVLLCGDDQYTLGDVISYGGSSVFYAAEKTGSSLLFGVKECCPSELAGRLQRTHGVLTGADEQSEYALGRARERMLWETSVSQEVAAVSLRSIPVLEAPDEISVETPEGTFSAPEGSFLILRQVSAGGMFLPELLAVCALPPKEGHPLRTGGRPSLAIVARIMEQVLRAVELVQVSGYLYGDVQPANIFFADAQPEKGDIGFGCLLDFGCARTMEDDFTGVLKTSPIRDRMVFSTPGFTAPEIIWQNDGTLRLTLSADVYSAGRLLLYLLKGRTFFENGRDRMLTERATLARLLPHEGEKLGCTSETLRLLQRLLDKSLAPEPTDRYPDAAAMLEDVEKLVKLTMPAPNRLALSFSTLAKGEFLGREDKLSEIGRALEERRKPVVIYGFAGMGKTELAIKFIHRYTQGQTYFVRFQGSVRQTVTGPIADAFSGYERKDLHGREKPEEQIYREVLKLLGQRGENDLLVLDNMDGEEDFDVLRGDAAFQDLCALPMGLLVTTRSKTEGGIEVDTLPRPWLRKLLRRFASDLSVEMADKLINAVDGHTLTVELLGRTLEHSIPRLTPEALLEKLTQGDLDSTALASVASVKDREGRKARIQGHLTALFRLSALPEEEKRLMCYALPISAIGLPAEKFAAIPDFDQDVLLHLIDRGWIRRSKEDILTLHPLVQETGWRELGADLWDIFRFASGIEERLLADFSKASAADVAQLTEYLRSVSWHSKDVDTHALAVQSMCELLEEQGLFLSVRELSLELIQWLKEQQRGTSVFRWKTLRKNSEAYDYTGYLKDAHFHCRYACKVLGLLEEAQTHDKLFHHYKTLQSLERLMLPALESQQGSGAPSLGLTPLEAEWNRRRGTFRQAVNSRQYEAAAELGEALLAWAEKNGFDTARHTYDLGDVYGKLGDRRRCLCLKEAACEKMEKWVQPTMDSFSCAVMLAAEYLQNGMNDKARTALSKALTLTGRMPKEVRHSCLSFWGNTVVEVMEEYPWPEETFAWRKALAEMDIIPTHL